MIFIFAMTSFGGSTCCFLEGFPETSFRPVVKSPELIGDAVPRLEDLEDGCDSPFWTSAKDLLAGTVTVFLGPDALSPGQHGSVVSHGRKPMCFLSGPTSPTREAILV